MLAKWWRKIGLFILIVACLFNITSKLVKRVSFSDNVKGTVSNKVENVVTQVKVAILTMKKVKTQQKISKTIEKNRVVLIYKRYC